MEVGWNVNTILSVGGMIVSIAGSAWIIRINWKQYGSLFLISGIVGVILCYIFIYFRFYSFPFRLFPSVSRIPFTLILTVFPFYVLAGVRYSPEPWAWKIPFYWILVHVGVTTEALVELNTDIIQYSAPWGLGDSYVWWWLYLLAFELVGGQIVQPAFRKPIPVQIFGYGKLGFYLLHFILITSIFMAGVYAGITLR